jgi:hypothetical protein
MAPAPDSKLAARVLPAPLYRALTHAFAQGITRCMLVGGTALAGYYAGHRKSDDLNLFAADESSWRAAVLAARSLGPLGAAIEERQRSSQFYSATCELEGHVFTVQVVLDPNLFAIGGFHRAADAVLVADLPTLLKMKAATLVSRCAEKDLYDLLWLFRQEPDLTLEGLVELGSEIDGGMSAEAVLTSLVGTTLSKSSCQFSSTETPAAVFRKVSSLKKKLARGFERIARAQPAPEIGELMRRLRPGPRRRRR